MKVTQFENVVTIEDGDAEYQLMIEGDFLRLTTTSEGFVMDGNRTPEGAIMMKRTPKDRKPKIKLVKPTRKRIIT